MIPTSGKGPGAREDATMTATTISETIRGSWRYGSHNPLDNRSLNSLKVREGFQATTYVFKGEGGYENEVPACQSSTKAGIQCSRTGIASVSSGWYAVVDAEGYAVCAQHAKPAPTGAPAAADDWQPLVDKGVTWGHVRDGIVVREFQNYGYERGVRWAEVYILVDSAGPAHPDNWHRACTVVKHDDIVSTDLRPADVNWSAWGDQTPETAERFALAIQQAARTARLFDEGATGRSAV